MPVLNPQKQHPSVHLRLPNEDRIAYHMVGDREPISHEIPKLLQSPLLGMLPFLPKSGLQYLDPIRYQQDHVRRNETQSVRFGVVFSDNFPDYADYLLAEPCFLHVFLWHTRESVCIQKLQQIGHEKVVLVPHPSLAKLLLKNGVQQRDLPATPKEIYGRIQESLRTAAEIPEDIFAKQRQKVVKLARDYHAEAYPRKALPFSPLRINVAQLGQLFGVFGEEHWEELPNDRSKRAAALAESFNGVSHALAFVRMTAKPQIKGRPPPAVITFPSINPLLLRRWSRIARKAPANLRKFARAMASARIAEQDSTDYMNRVDEDTAKQIIKAEGAGLQQLAAYSHFFDTVGYLHASFESSPYVRAPVKGGSLAKQHRYFSPGRFQRNPPAAEIRRRVYQFGETLANAIHPKIRESLHAYPGAVVAMSDLPLEWMDLKGTPLCFARDLCRMPEGIATNLLAQFARNSSTRFVITPDILSRTLVVCGAPDGDPVAENFRVMQEFHREQAAPRPRLERCESLEEFYQLVNEFRPELLIIDSHGQFVNNNSGTEIMFGDDHLDGPGVIDNLPQIPLVFLSACWGAPLYGCPNTIAHAFFETGSFAVTASLLPIGVQRGSLLYSRILRNLVMASTKDLHPDWCSFVSHAVRTSYLTDLDALVHHRLGITGDPERWLHARAKWLASTMNPPTREEAFKQAKDIVVGTYDVDMAAAVRDILDTKEYLPEFMFYSTMGRADLVKFEAWHKKRHEPGCDSVTIREMMMRAKGRKVAVAPP